MNNKPHAWGTGCGFSLMVGGKTGIRTLGARKGTTVFETAPIDHSGIFPDKSFNYSAKVVITFGTCKQIVYGILFIYEGQHLKLLRSL